MPKILFKRGHKINLGKRNHLGFKHSEETKQKIRNARLGVSPSMESNQKRRYTILKRKEILGYINSLEARQKISKIMKGRPKSEEHKRKLSKIFQGAKSSLWRGGKSFEPYSTKWTKLFRNKIRERDNYSCFICKMPGRDIHHIDYNKENCEKNNLITLCRTCHRKTNFNRENWIKYFNG
mgnify:CR=1 FL=1